MRDKLREHVSDKLKEAKEIILLGGEGHGKSWLSAQLCSESAGLALFISAEEFSGVEVNELDDFLINVLILQTGEVADDKLKQRWKYRFEAWKKEPPFASLLVVVDGLNQRQRVPWDRILNGIQSRLDAIGGKLIVTVRSHFWHQKIVRGLDFERETIDVPEWSTKERDELLAHNGIPLDSCDEKTLIALQNPRLLSIAVDTLKNRSASAWKGLTTDRLLMEYLRKSRLEKYENETFDDLTKRRSKHAKKVLKRVRESSNPPQHFNADSKLDFVHYAGKQSAYSSRLNRRI